MFVFGKTSLKNLHGVHPDLVKVLETALKTSSIDFTIDEGVRTATYQRSLWQKGRNAAGKIINRDIVVTNADGYNNRSNHQIKSDGWGHAVDLYPYIDGKVDYENIHGKQKELAQHIKSVAARLLIPITWGGDWTIEKEHIVDPPHFQLK